MGETELYFTAFHGAACESWHSEREGRNTSLKRPFCGQRQARNLGAHCARTPNLSTSPGSLSSKDRDGPSTGPQIWHPALVPRKTLSFQNCRIHESREDPQPLCSSVSE